MIGSAVNLMRKPIGIVIRHRPPRSIHILKKIMIDLELRYIATVGDIVTLNVIRYWRVPDIAVIDNRTLRGKEVDTLGTISVLFKDILRLHNKPSTLSSKSFDTIETSINLVRQGHNTLIVVDGEEDLLSLLVILYLDKGLVVYGNYFDDSLLAIPTTMHYKVATLKLLVQFRYETMG